MRHRVSRDFASREQVQAQQWKFELGEVDADTTHIMQLTRN